jgi:hypothetical protein
MNKNARPTVQAYKKKLHRAHEIEYVTVVQPVRYIVLKELIRAYHISVIAVIREISYSMLNFLLTLFSHM